MTHAPHSACTAFIGHRRLAAGTLPEVALAAKAAQERDAHAPLLVFDDRTGRVVDLDLRGTDDEVRARLEARDAPAAEAAPRHRGPGRPRLGVVSREVTLLPRHWAWLAAQREGASATLRRLVDQARKAAEGQDAVRRAQDVAFRFMSALGGDLPGYEEAIRALFRGDAERFAAELAGWPEDVRAHARALAADAFGGEAPGSGG